MRGAPDQLTKLFVQTLMKTEPSAFDTNTKHHSSNCSKPGPSNLSQRQSRSSQAAAATLDDSFNPLKIIHHLIFVAIATDIVRREKFYYVEKFQNKRENGTFEWKICIFGWNICEF